MPFLNREPGPPTGCHGRAKQHARRLSFHPGHYEWIRAETGRLMVAAIVLFMVVLTPMMAARAQEDISHTYQLTLSPHHRITDKLSGSATLSYENSPQRGYRMYYVSYPGVTYKLNAYFQLWGGLRVNYTDNENTTDKFELRPFVGFKLYGPHKLNGNVFIYTRYEDRNVEDLGTHAWTHAGRVRSQFGVEVPLASQDRSFNPRTWYLLASVEPFYRFDRGWVDPIEVQAGVAYVANSQLYLEFIYYTTFTRPAGSSTLRYTDNTFRLNVKIGLSHHVLGRLFNPKVED